MFFFFFFSCHGHHRHLHSFPTRRSSDLPGLDPEAFIEGAAELPGLETPAAVVRLGQAMRQMRRTTAALLSEDRKSTRLNSSHVEISYAVFCLKKKKKKKTDMIHVQEQIE